MTLQSIFPPLMVVTFIAAVLTLLLGVAGMTGGMMGTGGKGNRSTQLMALRVGLCALLLGEIVIYITFLRP